MKLWEKISADLQTGAATFSEKAADWLKSGADVMKGGVEAVSQKAAYTSKLAKLKWELNMLHREIEKAFIALGGQAYDLFTHQRLGEFESAAQNKLIHLQKLEAALEAKEKEIEDLPHSFKPPQEGEASVQELRKDLENGGGTIEQIVLTENSPIVGRKLLEIELPQDLLVGTIVRGEEVLIPEGNTEFQKGDRITLLGKKDAVAKARKMLTEVGAESTSASTP